MLGGALLSAVAAVALGLTARLLDAPVGFVVAAAGAGGVTGWIVFLASGGVEEGDSALLRLPGSRRDAAAPKRPMSAVIPDVPGIGSRRAAEHVAARAKRKAARARSRRKPAGGR
ncbi:MAG TPA: hypothetical protein VKU85_20390 [bacterium]|nr:hypothetical protein [bacterium]